MSSKFPQRPYLRTVTLLRDKVADFGVYPFIVAAIQTLKELELSSPVTFFVGENGSGKSTLLEAGREKGTEHDS